MPVAVNCSVVPNAMPGADGDIAMEARVAGVTVNVAEPDMLPDVAVIVVEPVATGVPSPLDPAALLIVAMAVDDDAQVTVVVRFCVVPSE